MRYISQTPIEHEGDILWECAGCKWCLKLPAGVVPPLEHTLDYPFGTPRDQFKDCPNPNWLLVTKVFA